MTITFHREQIIKDKGHSIIKISKFKGYNGPQWGFSFSLLDFPIKLTEADFEFHQSGFDLYKIEVNTAKQCTQADRWNIYVEVASKVTFTVTDDTYILIKVNSSDDLSHEYINFSTYYHKYNLLKIKFNVDRHIAWSIPMKVIMSDKVGPPVKVEMWPENRDVYLPRSGTYNISSDGVYDGFLTTFYDVTFKPATVEVTQFGTAVTEGFLKLAAKYTTVEIFLDSKKYKEYIEHKIFKIRFRLGSYDKTVDIGIEHSAYLTLLPPEGLLHIDVQGGFLLNNKLFTYKVFPMHVSYKGDHHRHTYGITDEDLATEPVDRSSFVDLNINVVMDVPCENSGLPLELTNGERAYKATIPAVNDPKVIFPFKIAPGSYKMRYLLPRELLYYNLKVPSELTITETSHECTIEIKRSPVS